MAKKERKSRSDVKPHGVIEGAGEIMNQEIDQTLEKNYMPYAMSVIMSRALPEIDGFKPSHRKLLYTMYKMGLLNSTRTKSANIVGQTMKLNPHGDSAIYDTMVRLSRGYEALLHPYVDSKGNFGKFYSRDMAWAASRYTEAKLDSICTELFSDIDKDTVDFVPNYDESLKEPSVLPSKFPELLVNGTSGIAVGMATNIPPHNMSEVIDGVLMLIDNPDASVEELMTVIKGPDFPTGGLIMGTTGIRDAYTTGRGSVKMRAKAHIETMSNGKPRIVVTELPYQVNKARLIEKIAELARDKQIEGITDLRDESDRKGMSIVIELRKDINPDIMLNQLYKHTQLQDTFGVIMLALVDNQPRILTLKQVLHYYIQHQEDVITRRTRYELSKAEARAHILEGLTIALDHLDAVITTIRESQTADIARNALMDGFKLSEKQAQAILDLRLQRLTGLEREKIEEEYQEVLKKIEWLKSVLADESKIMTIIKEELTAVKDKYGDARRTTITYDMSEMSEEDLIADEDVVLTISHNNYIKRMKLDTYNKQNRGGQGILGMSTKEGDFVENILITTTHHTILFFTSRGRVHYLKAYQIAEASRQARGTALINLLKLDKGEKITAVLQVREYNPAKFLFMATRKGIVKKVQLSEFNTTRKLGVIALKLDDDDELIGVKQTDGQKQIVIGTRNGYAIIFDEEEVRSMGRIARGVKGIKLRDGDEVVGMDTIKRDSEILTVTAGGYGKRTKVEEYTTHHRGAMGVINLRVTEKTGEVIGLKVVRDGQELMLISTNGIIIRTGLDKISVIGRASQGVIIMKTAEDDKVASMAILTQKAE